MTITMPAAGAALGARLCVERSDIRFRNVSDERVRIEITVRNEGDALSRPTPLIVEAAHFGAFLPWRPLARRAVPPIPPGGRRAVVIEARRPATHVVGAFESTSPGDLLTAVAGGDGRAAGLPGDLFQLLGRRQTHWVGNLNVFLGGERVERHRAPALRVHAGQLNLALFCLGSGRDAYCFDLLGEGAAWDARLFAGRGPGPLASFLFGHGSEPIEPGRWLEVERTHVVLACVRPPEDATRGALDVHVRQRSTGECAVVELDLDPHAAGPGCYVV